ncbi:Chaperone protein TorD [Moorella humiferrea]|uniref:TorD/DmsD family molecular chaperone n=1 Tax=Neomoorella humiferrea TaxID=676965 RepID=UPI0030CC362A
MAPAAVDAATREGIQILCEARALAYNLLRGAFIHEPSWEFLEWLIRQEVLSFLAFAADDPDIKKGVELFTGYLERYKAMPEADRDEELAGLRGDYTRLFIGPERLPAPPWESAYVNDERLLFQEVTLKVRRIYLSYNFLPRNYRREADDHIGLELEFMYRLSAMAAERLDAGDLTGAARILRDQEEFLDGHLLAWVPPFAGDVMANAATDFYRGMGSLLKGFVELDRRAVAEMLKALA